MVANGIVTNENDKIIVFHFLKMKIIGTNLGIPIMDTN
jgi:hypothetical protein